MTVALRTPAVCHLVYARYPADPRVRRDAVSLARRGYGVDVISLKSASEPPVEIIAGVSVTRIPLDAVRGSGLRYAYQYLLFLLLAAAKLTLKQVSRHYGIIHVHSMPDFLILAALPSRLLGSQVILDLHESMPELYIARFPRRQGSLVHRLTRVVQKLSCCFASRIVTVNDRIGQILERQGVPASRITILENSPDWTTDSTVFAEMPNSGVEEIVLVTGINPERDLEVVIRAAALLKNRFRLRWRIIGPGELSYIAKLRQLAIQAGVGSDVLIESEVPASDVRALIHSSSIGIVPYRKNPLTEIATPNKAYEYALAGKAMVVSMLPGLHLLLSDSVLYYTPGNAESLAARVADLLLDSNLRLRLGSAAMERMQGHKWEVMEARLLELYDHLGRSTIFHGRDLKTRSKRKELGGHAR